MRSSPEDLRSSDSDACLANEDRAASSSFFWGGPTKNHEGQSDRKNQNQSFAPANRGPKGQSEHTTRRNTAPHHRDRLQARRPDNNSKAKEDACCQWWLSPSYSETRDVDRAASFRHLGCAWHGPMNAVQSSLGSSCCFFPNLSWV